MGYSCPCAAKECFNAPTEASGDAAHDESKVSALDLAKLLCKNFADKPVKAVVFGEEDADEELTCRIGTTMVLQKAEIIDPMAKFVSEVLTMPLMLHEAPRNAIAGLTSTVQTGSIKTMVHLVSFFQDKIQACLPFSWVSFAADVSEVFTTKGHFVEKTDKAHSNLFWRSAGISSVSVLKGSLCIYYI